jgi:hypothetical protein
VLLPETNPHWNKKSNHSFMLVLCTCHRHAIAMPIAPSWFFFYIMLVRGSAVGGSFKHPAFRVLHLWANVVLAGGIV